MEDASAVYIVKVSPFTKSFRKETLSYFSQKKYDPGMVINVPIRSSLKEALVLDCDTVSNLKTEIKSAGFNLKKIPNQEGSFFFSPRHIKAASKTAHISVNHIGGILETITPKVILKERISSNFVDHNERAQRDTYYEPLIIQCNLEERLSHYKNIVRESFAKDMSVLFCVPTVQDGKKIHEFLKKGIEGFTFFFTSKRTDKKILELWKACLEEKHPVVIIATGGFVSIPRTDIGSYVIEHESSPHFKTKRRPNFNIKTYIEFLARENRSRVIYGDSLLSVETYWHYKNGDMRSFVHPRARYFTNTEFVVIDMNEHGEGTQKKDLQVFSHELLTRLKRATENRQRSVVFVSRKGLYPITLCGDCGTIVRSEYSDMPVVVKEIEGERYFVCPTTGKKRSALETCKECNSWNLVPLGIGIDRVFEDLTALFDAPMFQIDSDSLKTPKQIENVVSEFESSTNGILVTTEQGLSYLSEPVPFVSVVTMDSLFAIPDINMNHKIFELLLKLKYLSSETCLIQYRNADLDLLNLAGLGNAQEFITKELRERKAFDYPPYSRLVKITFSGTREQLKESRSFLQNAFMSYRPDFYPAFVPQKKNNYIFIGLMKVNEIDEMLRKKLSSLPPSFNVDVDPESIL